MSTQSLNILLVTDSFYPDGFGGCHTYVYYLAKGLIAKGHHVVVATLRIQSQMPETESIDKIKVFRYKASAHGKFLFLRRPLSMYISLGMRSPWHPSDFDLIHHHDLIAATAMLQLSRMKKVPMCYTFHSSVYDDVTHQQKKKSYGLQFFNRPMLSVIKSMENYVLMKSKKIMVLSDFSRGYILNHYPQVIPNNIEEVAGGVDGKVFTSQNSPGVDGDFSWNKRNFPKNKKIIVTARRLVARMGLENLIEAAVLIRKKRDDFFIAVFGDGFLKEKLQQMINENNLQENFTLMGKVDFKELPSFYRAADFFIMPSEFSEWFGLATIEALSCGLPAIGTSAGATKEILGRIDYGLVIPGVSADIIADTINKFLSIDKTELIKIGKRGREFVESNYSWERATNEVEAVYRCILNGG
ncbi:MAG: glycosyltransferase family 4 protein [Ignavibacteriales bacterium]|nr:glycosyltransferase family 4 protein [Ignavibacteriales bacterium]